MMTDFPGMRLQLAGLIMLLMAHFNIAIPENFYAEKAYKALRSMTELRHDYVADLVFVYQVRILFRCCTAYCSPALRTRIPQQSGITCTHNVPRT
jgi:hypothetical protein